MSKPDISVIVTNYNHSMFLAEAVVSVLEQTKTEFEVIIIDDCSTDKSKDVIEMVSKLDDRIQKPIYLEENKGKWFALNTAIAQAKGKLITLNDADDTSHPLRLERQHHTLVSLDSFHNLCGFAHCHNEKDFMHAMDWEPRTPVRIVMEHATVVKNVLHGHKTPGINHYYVGQDYEVHGASSMFYKQLWERGMKFLPGNMGLRCQLAEDSDHNTKMTLLLQKTSVLEEPLYCYRRGTSTNGAWLEAL
jgi:glycosyltransferase involved in cell wall biosynthesis